MKWERGKKLVLITGRFWAYIAPLFKTVAGKNGSGITIIL